MFLPWIQVARGIAALAVVAFHTNTLSSEYHTGPTIFMKWLGANGRAGVDLFFVISGFVMMVSTSTTTSRGDFLIKRAIRLVPLYWCLTLLYLMFWTVAPSLFNRFQFDLWHAIGSFLFFPAVSAQGVSEPIIPYGWSLNYEVFFYFVFCLFMPFRLELRMIGVTVFFGLLMFAAKYLAASDILNHYADPIIVEFAIGMLLGWLYFRADRRRPFLYILSAALFALLYLALSSTAAINHRLIYYGIPSAAAVSCLLALESYEFRAPRGLVFLGNISYSIYLVQVFTMPATIKLIQKAGIFESTNPSLLALLILVVTCATASLSHKLIEEPPRRWKLSIPRINDLLKSTNRTLWKA